MRGSVYKRCQCPSRTDSRGRRLTCTKEHGSWSYRVDLTGRAGAANRRGQVVRGGFPTKAAAEQALAEALTASQAGQLVPDRRLRLGAYLIRWLEVAKMTLERPAWTNYEAVIALYVTPHLDAVLLCDLRPGMLNQLYTRLLAGGGRGGRALSTTTVRLVHRVLHKALQDALRDGLLASNPAERAQPPRRRTAETTIWNAEQVTTFLAASQHDRLYVAWLIALTCGLRRGELGGLRWRDIDFGARTLTVASQRTTDASTQVVVKGPKGTSRRTLDLADGALAALRQHQARQLAELTELGVSPSGDALVLLREDGVPYRPQRLTELFHDASRRARVPQIRLHDARHSCATLALNAGIHPKVVQQLLGHASWSTTMDLYSHKVQRLQRDATARIEALVRPTPAASAVRAPRSIPGLGDGGEQVALF